MSTHNHVVNATNDPSTPNHITVIHDHDNGLRRQEWTFVATYRTSFALQLALYQHRLFCKPSGIWLIFEEYRNQSHEIVNSWNRRHQSPDYESSVAEGAGVSYIEAWISRTLHRSQVPVPPDVVEEAIGRARQYLHVDIGGRSL